MRIIYKTGSILDAEEQYIVHGCNAQGRMGSGVARVLYERYPNVRKTYLAAHASAKREGVPFLGTVGYCENDPHTVINAITQEFFGYDGALYVSYEAVEQCMVEINRASNDWTVAMPLIGAGLAGGSWARISEIIERVSTDFQPVVYTLDGNIPET